MDDWSTITDIADAVDLVNALGDGKALMTGNLADRNPKI